MWVEDLPNGKYKFIDRFYIETTGKIYKPSVTLDSKSKQAENKARDLLYKKYLDKLNAKSVNSSHKTFKEISEDWLAFKKNNSLKLTTVRNVQSRLNVINQSLGDYRIDKLKTYTINQFLIESTETRSFRTVNIDKSIIAQIMNFASDNQLIPPLPYKEMLKVPNKERLSTKTDWKYLERDELQFVIDKLEEMGKHEIANMCRFQASTGMRFNEMMALDYTTDIDKTNKTITISKNYDSNNRIFTSTKTNESRTINITDETLRIVDEQIIATQRKILKYGLDKNIHRLFINSVGYPYHTSGINRTLRSIKIKDKKISTHIFRHTFITLMVESGVDKNLIAKHVGHSSTKMIDKVYSHFTNDMSDQLKKAIENHKII